MGIFVDQFEYAYVLKLSAAVLKDTSLGPGDYLHPYVFCLESRHDCLHLQDDFAVSHPTMQILKAKNTLTPVSPLILILFEL